MTESGERVEPFPRQRQGTVDYMRRLRELVETAYGIESATEG